MTQPFWLTAFLDLPADRYDAGVDFWEGVTGYRRSAPRGPSGEFASLLPSDGDDFLRIQRVADGQPRIHLDVHVVDPGSAAEELTRLGAAVIADEGDFLTLASPGGMVFCLVSHPAAVRPAPRSWPGGSRTLVDQVCLDIAPSAYDAECAFWRHVTGWELRQRAGSEFSSLVRPPGSPLRLLLQRLDDGELPVHAHLDLASRGRDAEVLRHVGLGAVVERRHEFFTVLHDPTGRVYCVTDRDPETGVLRRPTVP